MSCRTHRSNNVSVTAVEVHNLIKSFRKSSGASGNGSARPRGLLRRKPRPKPVTVLDVPSLEVRPREILGVLGPNGSGKSTLIRIISTLLLPDRGSVTVFGRDVVREPLAVQRMLNRVSADAAFFRKLSAMENLIHTARLYGLPQRQSIQRVKAILGRLDLSQEKMDAEMHELSRGMQQKVALARAFLTSPILMLLDEPTTGLDLKSKKEVQSFILEIRRDHDATVLLTTHDMVEAEALCDRIAIIDGGKIIAIGDAAVLKAMAGERGSRRALDAAADAGGRGSCRAGDTLTLEEAFLALTGHTMEAAEAAIAQEAPAA